MCVAEDWRLAQLEEDNISVESTQQICCSLRHVSPKQLKKRLASLGATFASGKGGHIKVFLNGRRSVLPMGSGDLKRGTAEAILKQLGIGN
jgi:mRNA interferase HicA